MILHFWWSHNASPKPIHWLKRKTLFEDKDLGGLGLRCPIAMNSALLLKQTWRIQSDPNLLISKVFKAKYFKTSSLLLAGLGSSPSHAWRSLFKIKHHLMDGIVFREGDERPIWKLSSCGEYTAKTGYHLLKEASIMGTVLEGGPSELERYRTFWKRFWKIQLPGKIKIFGWRCFHNGLPDALNLGKRCLQICSSCVFCGFESEDLCHLLRDCWVAKAVGMNLQLPDRIFEVSTGTPGDWFWWCSTELSETQFRSLLCAAWCIWSSRNAIRHDKEGWSVMEMVAKVQSLIGQWDRYASNKFADVQLSGEARHQTIFCDGSWIDSHSPCGIAAVYIVNGDIRVISAKYLCNVRSSREAEGEALCLGLKLADSMKLPSVTLFSDSAEVAGAFFNHMISGSFQPYWLTSGIKILANYRNWRVEHCLRDRNNFADSVAKYARAFSWSWNNLEELPSIDFVDV